MKLKDLDHLVLGLVIASALIAIITILGFQYAFFN